MTTRLVGRWCWSVVALTVLSFPLTAQEAVIGPPRTIAASDLGDRLEKLERQNQELSKKLDLLQKISPPSSADPQADKGATSKSASDKKDDKAGDKSFQVGKYLKMDGSWKHGLWFESQDKAFKFYTGGVIQFDMGWTSADPSLVQSVGVFNNLAEPSQALQDAMTLRRALLRFSGVLYEQFEFFSQYDFASSLDLRRRTIGATPTAPTPTIYDTDPGDATLFNEVYVGLHDVPWLGQIRAGRHRESLNFVTATSDTNQVWLERGLMFDAFNGDYNFSNGITLAQNHFDDRAYTMFGFFQQNNNFANRTFSSVGDGEYAYDFRFSFLPFWDEEDELWIHLGADYSYRNLHDERVRYRARPMIRTGSSFQVPSIVNTGTLFSDDAQQIANLEFAGAWGRWTFAAEYAVSWLTNTYTGGLPVDGKLPVGAKSVGDYFADGGYVELLYFLTPDHRPYNKKRPGYDRVVPRANFFFLDGEHGLVHSLGAWEIGARYDYIDLTRPGVNGGTAQAITLALNWYLHPNMRIQTNTFWMCRAFNPTDPPDIPAGRVNGDLYGLGIRFNCDF